MNPESENINGKIRLGSGRVLALLMLAALLVRILAVLTRPMIQLDETAYVRMAENLAAGNGLFEITGVNSTHFSPLLPLLTAGVAFIVRNYVIAAYIVVVVFGCLMLLPAYLLGKELANEKIGLMTAALLAVSPIFVDYSSRIYTESVYIFFLLLAVVFGHHMLKGCRIPCGTLAGAALGMAYLANPSAVFYLVALVVLAVIVAFIRGTWRRMAKALAVFLLFFLLYATPYVIFLHSELGTWTYSGKVPGNIYASTNNLRHGTLAWEKDLLSLTDDHQEVHSMRLEDERTPLSFILLSPKQAMRNFVQQSHIFYTEQLNLVLPLWLLPLLGLGLLARGWSRRRAAAVGYLLVMMLPALLILAMYAHTRFFMPFVPFVLIWVAEGWQRFEIWGDETVLFSFPEKSKNRWKRWAPAVVGVMVIAPLLLFSAATVKSQSYPVGYRDAGEWIKQEVGDGKRIMSREFSAAYYAGGTAVPLPYADLAPMDDYAQAKQVDYLVISKQEINDWRPQLEALLDSGADPHWRLIQDVRPGTSQETVILEYTSGADR